MDPKADILVHGDARGADRMAEKLWKQLEGACVACPADWKTFGRAAGPMRNASMLADFPIGRVFAFCKNASKGTLHMIGLARRKRIPCEVFDME